MEVFRASGPGGQHVNRTESALRLVLPPSGVVVIAQDSSSQHRNRDIAFGRLIERLARLNHVPRKRVATKPTRASKERRLAAAAAAFMEQAGHDWAMRFDVISVLKKKDGGFEVELIRDAFFPGIE